MTYSQVRGMFQTLLLCLGVLSVPVFLGAEEVPPSLEALKKRFGEAYSCPGCHGLGSFSADLYSDQISIISRNTGTATPKLRFQFSDRENFAVELPPSFPAHPAKNDMLSQYVQAIAMMAEGFFQNYVTIGFGNLFEDIPGSASIRIDNERLVVEFPDRMPEHWNLLDFDGEFVLAKMEARDLINDTRSILRPIWTKTGGKHVLTGLIVEHFNERYEQADFMTRMKIENAEVGGFLLPARVVVQARDGKGAQSPIAIFDFRLDNYLFGAQRPNQKE